MQTNFGEFMKKMWYLFVISILSISAVLSGCSLNFFGASQAEQNFDSQQIDVSRIESYDDLVATCKPAVVGIVAQNGKYQSIGTGVSVKKGAYVLTNNHVIENGNVINLYMSDGTTSGATLVWTDASSDLAMLKSQKDIPYLPMAQADSYRSGDEVIAIGTPIDLAFKHSVTKGIISATNRTIAVDGDDGTSTLYNLIQHDASINPGNSGGPLINMKGQVIGINTVKVTDAEGMGFAIPVDTFAPAIEKVSANGSFDTAYMGVFGYDNQLKNIGRISNGFYVQDVAKDSPAQFAGIKNGDIITKIDGTEISLAKDLKVALYNHNVGDKVLVEYIDGDTQKQVEVVLKKHPYAYSAPKVQTIKND